MARTYRIHRTGDGLTDHDIDLYVRGKRKASHRRRLHRQTARIGAAELRQEGWTR